MSFYDGDNYTEHARTARSDGAESTLVFIHCRGYTLRGGITTPNICIYTWICAVGDIHPTDLGYSVIADTFAAAIPED
jgi:hypothetical protein